MKTFILLFMISISAWSRVDLELKLGTPQVKQGQIVSGTLTVKETSGNSALSGLKDQNIGQTLYVQKISAFVMKGGELTADVSVIFAQVPKADLATEVISGDEVTVRWPGITVTPTEATKSFLFGDFEAPTRLNFIPWIIGLLTLGIGLIIFRVFRKKLAQKEIQKTRRQKLRNELVTCDSYDEIVLMWRQKDRFLAEFPVLEKEFKNFEETLFKHQFKPQRTEKEVEDVILAYQKFKANVAGALHGI